jgi:hypothetical protein
MRPPQDFENLGDVVSSDHVETRRVDYSKCTPSSRIETLNYAPRVLRPEAMRPDGPMEHSPGLRPSRGPGEGTFGEQTRPERVLQTYCHEFKFLSFHGRPMRHCESERISQEPSSPFQGCVNIHCALAQDIGYTGSAPWAERLRTINHLKKYVPVSCKNLRSSGVFDERQNPLPPTRTSARFARVRERYVKRPWMHPD